MDEILSKRIVLLTNAIIILSALGFLALIHHIDASYKEKEYIALNGLRNCIEAIPKDAGYADVRNPAAKSWLMNNNQAVFTQHHQLADSIAFELSEAGFSDQIRDYKTSGSPDNNMIKPGGFVLLNISETDTANCCDHGFGDLTGNNKLIHFMEQYNHLLTPTKITVATGMDKNAVHDQLIGSRLFNNKANENIIEEYPVDITLNNRVKAAIKSARFDSSSFQISFQLTSSYYQEMKDEVIKIPLHVTTIDGPTWMDLYSIDHDYIKLGQKTELQKIVKHYGDLPMDKVIDMIGNDYMQAFENVDIFGFSFSTTSLPLALLVFFSFLSTGLYLMVREAQKQKLKVLSEFQNEDITDYFVKRPFIRAIIWLAMPVLSILATLPALPVEIEKLAVLISGAVILGVLNTITLLKAKTI